jgi:hypothetical protein
MLNRREISYMKVTGKIVGANIDFRTNKPTLTLEVNERNDFESIVDDLKDKDKLSIEIKPFRQHRSLNANAYCWVLIGKIADVVRAGKDEVYLKCLKRYGQSELISVLSHVPIGNYLKYYEEAGESKLNGKMFTHYRVYKGSSEFDTREMSIFIDGVVSEAKDLGIQTETPNQLAEMKARWGE